jgi:hypothetical protein
MKGATALITSLNIAYDEEETRSFVRLNLIALAITAGAVLIAIVAIIAIAAMGSLNTLFPLAPAIVLLAGKIVSYVVMAGVGAAAAATVDTWFGTDDRVVASRYPGLWVLCGKLRQLRRDLRLSGGRDRTADLALPFRLHSAAWRRVQLRA